MTLRLGLRCPRRKRSLLRSLQATYALWLLSRSLLKRSRCSSGMNGHCDLRWLSRRQTRQNGVFSIVDKLSMFFSSDDTAFVVVVHESIAITNVPEEFLVPVDGPDVVHNFTLCTPNLELAHVDFRYGAPFFILFCPAEVGSALLSEMSFPSSLISNVAYNAGW